MGGGTLFDESSQESDTGSNSTDSNEWDDIGNENDIGMSANQNDNPTTVITTSVSNHPSSVITDKLFTNIFIEIIL